MKTIYSISFLALLFLSCSNSKFPKTDLEEQKLRGKVFKLITIENESDTIFETFNENGYLLRQIIRDSNGLFSDWKSYIKQLALPENRVEVPLKVQ